MKRCQFVIQAQRWMLTLAVLLGVLAAQPAHAQRLQWAKVYVKMDYWKVAGEQSAEAWHFDPNNNSQWTKLSNDPNPPDLRPRALFEIGELFPTGELENWLWFTQVESIDVVRGDPGSFQSVGNIPAYSQMIDFMAMKLDGEATRRQSEGFLKPHDPCGNRIWPIGTGSEMTPYSLFPHALFERGGYGMRMVNWELLGSAAWRWKNPASVVADENVYIEFKIWCDLDDLPDAEEDEHHDVIVSWISAGGGCGYNFCVNEGTSSKIGTPFDPRQDSGTVVVAVPHIMDHGTGIGLNRTRGLNVYDIDSQIPVNSLTHPASHKCEPDGDENAWHAHSGGETGHLGVHPFAGLTQWHGEVDLQAGDKLVTVSSFDVPAHNVSAPINNRALYMVFWFGTFPNSGP